ncbi:MAG: hypothetical protein O2970_12175 [Proteobacteria bacterium]|nr:hypothetical protein [Pseudomonadota bacterium]MDA0967692.1 hypothetical protein [Pseudomonadota bacterium]
MRVFFLLGHTFFEQSISIAKEINQQIPNSEFRAIVAARSNLMDELDKIKDPEFSNYDWLSGLERKWLETPLDMDKLKDYEKKLGTNIIRRIITADREIGVGFVSGGIVERTELIKLTKNNDDARWRYVVGLLDYLFTEYENHRPDAIFAYCVAGSVAFAMGEVAHYFGIPFTQPVIARIKHCCIMDDNNYWSMRPVTDLFDKALKNPSLVADKMDEAKQFIQDFRERPIAPQDTVSWIKELKQNNSYLGIMKTLAKDLVRCVAIKLGLEGTKGVLRQRNGLDILKKNLLYFYYTRKALNNKVKFFHNEIGNYEYIYFPLHVDPEASTMVLADMFTDQMSVIESIARAMPVGMRLVVKEHIPCLGLRPKGFYKRIANMPDVILVNPFLDNFKIMQEAKLVCTIPEPLAGNHSFLVRPPLLSVTYII